MGMDEALTIECFADQAMMRWQLIRTHGGTDEDLKKLFVTLARSALEAGKTAEQSLSSPPSNTEGE